jgi:hypothetical protein
VTPYHHRPTQLMHIAKRCECVAGHCPAAYVPNHHHVLPQSWGGLTEDANLVWLCPNSHTAVHDLLNQYVHEGRQPDESVLLHYNTLVRELAARAWSRRPSDHPPYTTAHP